MALDERLRVFAGEVDLYDSVGGGVVRDVERPVRVDVRIRGGRIPFVPVVVFVVIVGPFFLGSPRRRRPDKAPDRQVVQKQLEPEVVPHGPGQAPDGLRVEHLRADPLFLFRDGLEERETLDLRVHELVPAQDFAQPSPFPGRPLVLSALRAAERQGVVIIRLLRVSIRADFVDPEAEGVAALVLVGRL